MVRVSVKFVSIRFICVITKVGKKRVAIIGDVFEEEVTRKKRAIQREQKKIRAGETIEAEEQTSAEEVKKLEELKELQKEGVKEFRELQKGKKERQDVKAKSAKAAGMKGGERVVDASSESMEELVRLKEKELELEKLKAEITGEKAPTKMKRQRVRSKRYLVAKRTLRQGTGQAGDQAGRPYSVTEAVKHIRKINLTRFPATVELHVNLIKKDAFSNQVVDLPHGTGGEQKKVVVVSDAVLKQLAEGRIDFDVLLASPKDMPKLVQYAKLLGPRGLMPNPKTGTIADDPAKVKDKFSADNRLEIKVEKKAPLIHTVAGKLSMKDDQLVDNINSILDTVGKKFIQRAYLASTMSPSVRLEM